MKRPVPLLVLLALALAAGAWWIATGGGPAEERGAMSRAQEEQRAPTVPHDTDLTEVPARIDTERTGEPFEADRPGPIEVATRRSPERTSAGVNVHTLRFRLEDDRGEPVESAKFTYRARGAEDDAEDEVFESRSATGVFRLGGLVAGEVHVVVEAYVLDPEQEPGWHAVPGTGEPILLTFVRRASIAGRVIDDAGFGVRDVRVNILRNEKRDHPEQLRSTTDDDGAFEFEPISAGPVTLTTSNGFISAELELVLGAGEEREDVELRLEGGGTVQGRVLDAMSRPVAGVDVLIVDTVHFRTNVETDEEGAFRLGPILPGTYQVTTILKDDPKDDVFDQIVSQPVTVAKGAVVDVLLQPKPGAPIALSGRVTYAGAELADCVVYGFREDESLLEAVRMARTNDEGEYSLKLAGPGAYIFLFEPRDNTSDNPTAPLRADIPDAVEVHLDLAVPASSIEGTVVDADGEPAAGAFVVAIPSDDYMDFELPEAQRGVSSNSKGHFTVPYLAAGEYVLRARATDPSSPLAWEPLEGVQVREDEPTTGIELRATAGGTVTGVVKGPEGPVEGAAVWVRDGAGRILFLRGTATDAAGAFRISGVPEGEIRVTARAPGLASAESERKLARSGDETKFTLRLAPASLLTARAVDARRAGVSCSIHVHDASGRDVTRVTSMERSVGNFSDALSTTARTVGPLPAGQYEVVATTRDGRRASRRVKVDGVRATEVEIRF